MRAILMAVLLCVFSITPAERVYITGLRAIQKPAHWQLVLESTGPIHYQYHYLSHPERAIFDITNAGIKKKFSRTDYLSTPVSDIKIQKKGADLCLIFTLDHKSVVTSYLLPAAKGYPHRLLISVSGRQIQSHPIIRAPNSPIKRDVVVVIDPGHGGKDPGATGLNGTHEKNVVLAISKNLQRDINNMPGFKAVLTRSGDYFVSLRGRLAIARRYKADMFIAIHADAYKDHDAQGVSIYALSQRGATSEAAHWLAKEENQSELMGGLDLSDKSNLLKSVLINLSQAATIRSSLELGEDLVRNVGSFAQLHRGHRIEQAAFVVLKSPDIPSLLIETGFISNKSEENRLISPAYQARLAQSISQGVSQYFTVNKIQNL